MPDINLENRPERRIAREAGAAHLIGRNRESIPVVGQGETAPSVVETAVAFWKNETLVGSMLEYGLRQGEDGNPAFDDSDQVNTYRYILDRQDAFGDMVPHLRQGLFPGKTTEKALLARVTRLRREAKTRETIEQGSVGGYILGMGMSVLDVSTLIPGAAAVRGLKTGKAAAKLGGAVAGEQALIEGVLHGTQDLRTMEESLAAIGTAAALGGGIGAIASRLSKSGKGGAAVLHPRHPDNPLDLDNTVPEGIATHGRPLSDADVEDLTGAANDGPSVHYTYADRSVGAAEVEVPDYTNGVRAARVVRDELKAHGVQSLADLDTKSRLSVLRKARRADRPAKWFKGVTPVGRLMRYASPTMRRFGSEMLDLGGSITAKMEKGQAVETAEDIKARYFHEYETLHTSNYDALYELNVKLAGGDPTDPTLSQGALAQGLRDTASRISNYGRQLFGKPEDVRLNPIEVWEFAEVTQRALFDDLDDTYRTQLVQRFGGDGAREVEAYALKQADRIHTANQRVEDAMVEAGLIKDEQRMGKAYGMAQLWDPKGIRANWEEARHLFMEVLSKEPTEEYLQEAWGLAGDDFAKLGKSELSVPKGPHGELDKISIEEGVRIKREILEDWSGSSHQQRIDKAHRDAEVATKEAEEWRKIAADLSHQMRDADGVYSKATLKEAKAIAARRVQEVETLRTQREKLAAEERELITAAEAARQKTADRAKVLDGEKPVKSTELAKLEGRLREITSQRTRIESKLKKQSRRLEALEEALGNADIHTKAARANKKEAQRLARLAGKEAEKSGRKATRLARKVQKVDRKLPVAAQVDQLLHKLADSSKIPFGVVDTTEVFELARAKTRKIRLSKAQRRRAAEAGILRDDLYGVLEKQYQQTSARLALYERFGSDDLADIFESVSNDYNSLKGRMRADGFSEKEIAELDGEAARARKDIEGLRDRLLGTYSLPDNPESLALWSLEKLREWNFIRFGAGFLLSSLTDLASNVLVNGFRPMLEGRFRKALAKELSQMSRSEIRTLAVASESVLHNARAFKVADVSDIPMSMGVGELGTRKHRITSNVDRAMKGLGEKVNRLSGLEWWNTRLKALTMIIQQDNLLRGVEGYDDLLAKAHTGDLKAKQQVGHFASLGIGEDQIRTIRKVLEDVPALEEEGVRRFAFEKLDHSKAEHREIHGLLTGALRKATHRSVMTPGIGDTPLFMSNPVLKTITQFQTYGYVSVNRFLSPMHQRITHYKDMDMVLNAAFTVALGTAVVAGKDALRGRDPLEKKPVALMHDILDRSGYLAWTSPYVAMGMKMAGSETSRYAYTGIAGQMMGPSFGTAQDLLAGGYSLRQGNLDKARQKLERLAPYSFYLQLADRLSQ